jgi:hypothetical protein
VRYDQRCKFKRHRHFRELASVAHKAKWSRLRAPVEIGTIAELKHVEL